MDPDLVVSTTCDPPAMADRIRLLKALGARRRRKAFTQADKEAADMQAALIKLGIRRPVAARVRIALRFNAWALQFGDPDFFVRFPLMLMGVAWAGGVLRLAVDGGRTLAGLTVRDDALGALVDEVDRTPGIIVGTYAFVLIFMVPLMVVCYFLILFGPMALAYMAWARAYPAGVVDMGVHAMDRRFGLVAKVAEAVAACGAAYGAGGSRRATSLRRNVAAKVAVLETILLRAPRSRGTVPFRSHRRKALRAHARLVASRLRVAEARMDVDGDEALPELAELMLTVAERYTDGRVAALLDQQELEGIEPVRDREPVRVAAVILLTVAGAVGVSSLGLPAAAEGPAIAGFGLLALMLVYGRRARRRYDLLTVFGGGGAR
ncbi:hypothetical protein GCM10010302_35810 [Streptomyces polychromogenes]|uniref:Type II secretion system protein GspF domain-containing protein n=2 Tax=Streptomyces TaxID=1883 RepID=A0ABN0VER5_9ACTN